MVETSTIDVTSSDTVLVEKLRLSDSSKDSLRTRENQDELLFLFTSKLTFDRRKHAPSEKLEHELWIGVGTILEIAEKALLVRYLPPASDIAIVGHSVHRPQSALVVLTSVHKLLRKTPVAPIDPFTFFLIKGVRHSICPQPGCLFVRDEKDAPLCEHCIEAQRDADERVQSLKTRMVAPCAGCGREIAMISRFCPSCRAARRADSIHDQRNRDGWEALSWDDRE